MSASESDAGALQDSYLWLEDVRGDEALNWVREQNAQTISELEADPRFESLRANIEEVLMSDDRIPFGGYDGRYVYNFWQDRDHTLGFLRRTSLDSYCSDEPEWETVLDIDALAAAEGVRWVYQGWQVLKPSRDRALLMLSPGGQDAGVVREFDLESLEFVDSGFEIGESKTVVDWLDRDHVLVGTDFGPGSMTDSGYPRVIRRWRRGQALADAELVFEAEQSDVGAYPFVCWQRDRADVFMARKPDFFGMALHRVRGNDEIVEMPVHPMANCVGVFDHYLLLSLREAWTVGDIEYAGGSLVAVDLDEFDESGEIRVEAVFVPSQGVSVDAVVLARNCVYVLVLEDVTNGLVAIQRHDGGWSARTVDLPGGGTLNVVSASQAHDQVMVSYESFLIPTSVYLVEGTGEPRGPVKSLPPRFDVTGISVEQRFAISLDGTRVPYFLVCPDNLPEDGTTPTWQWGYGGYQLSIKPNYLSAQVMQWVVAGNAFVSANIRGGGEYGPAWHQAALRENRHKAFEDFIAVSEDLIAAGVTSPMHLGIHGGSNGGLLVGAMLTQRPDLYNAVICQVPLLDMLRFHKLLAGASWMAEYGDPEDATDREYLLSYSPYHNLRQEIRYPRTLFLTSINDDRVHPGHARKMAARMVEQGHDMLYYENLEGGHGGAADNVQRAHLGAFLVTYLLRTL